MKVFVLWENPNEKDYACNLAKVLDKIGGSLAAEADVDGDGNVTMSVHGGRAVPKMDVQAANYRRAAAIAARVEAEPEPEPEPEPPPITDPSIWLLHGRLRDRDAFDV